MKDAISSSIMSSIWMKLISTVVMGMFLMIPVCQIDTVTLERESTGHKAKAEVREKWSQRQSTGVVVLSAPATQTIVGKDDNGKRYTYTDEVLFNFSPSELKIKVGLKSIIRYRGIFKVPVYVTVMNLSGSFEGISPETFEMTNTKVHWDKLTLSLGVDDLRGVKQVEIKWNDIRVKEYAGNMPSGLVLSALNGRIPDDPELKKSGTGQFSIDITLRGSEQLDFIPMGQATTVEVDSDWGSPSFVGAFLPEVYENQGGKFNANWKVLGINRSLPKHWKGTEEYAKAFDTSRFGVKLYLPLQNYRLNIRATKYAILFILLTFVTLFFIEVLYRYKFHIMHYLMAGAGLVIFYLLLLSFSEHLGFGWAYLIASLAITLTISLFVYGISNVKKSAFIVFSQLSWLYGFLYILLHQEEYALLFGSIGLWLVLVLLMIVTRKVDWYNLDLAFEKKVKK